MEAPKQKREVQSSHYIQAKETERSGNGEYKEKTRETD